VRDGGGRGRTALVQLLDIGMGICTGHGPRLVLRGQYSGMRSTVDSHPHDATV
jgi:hypothetical protein